jgi:hypothetical protein
MLAQVDAHIGTHLELASQLRFSVSTLNTSVMLMVRALLGTRPVNISRPNTHKTTIEESPFLCSDDVNNLQLSVLTIIGVKNERCFLCGLCETYITSTCYSLDETKRLVQSAYKRNE